MIDLHTEFYRIFLNSKKLCYSSFLLKNSIIYNFWTFINSLKFPWKRVKYGRGDSATNDGGCGAAECAFWTGPGNCSSQQAELWRKLPILISPGFLRLCGMCSLPPCAISTIHSMDQTAPQLCFPRKRVLPSVRSHCWMTVCVRFRRLFPATFPARSPSCPAVAPPAEWGPECPHSSALRCDPASISSWTPFGLTGCCKRPTGSSQAQAGLTAKAFAARW